MAGEPFDQRDGVIWYNGELVPWSEAKLHVLSHALHYASSVFEGERAYGGEIFKLREHTERLFHSAERMDMEIPYTVEEIDEACKQALAAQGYQDAYVRPVAWRGSEMMGVSAQTTGSMWRSRSGNGHPISTRAARQGHPPGHFQMAPPGPDDHSMRCQGGRSLHDLYIVEARR